MSYELVTAVKAGSPYAVEDLLRRISPDVKHIVWHFLGTRYSHRIDAEDVIQEVLFEVARDVASCYATDWNGFMGWVYFVARNTTYKQVSLIKLGKSPAAQTQTIGESWEAGAKTHRPDDILIQKETLSAVMALACDISERSLEIVELLAVGTTPNEIAETLGVSTSEVYSVRRTLKSRANETGVFKTRESTAWARSSEPVAAEKPAAVKVNSAKKAMFKSWKSFVDSIRAMEPGAEQDRLIRNLIKAFDRLPEEDKAEMADAIGMPSLHVASELAV